MPDIFSVWKNAGYLEPTIEEFFGEDESSKTVVALPLVEQDYALFEDTVGVTGFPKSMDWRESVVSEDGIFGIRSEGRIFAIILMRRTCIFTMTGQMEQTGHPKGSKNKKTLEREDDGFVIFKIIRGILSS